MTPDSMPLDALLGHVSNSDQDTLREILEHTLQALIEAEAAGVVGAQPHERSNSRLGYRNGHRQRIPDTRVGRLELGIPKLRRGSYLPSLLEPRRRIERAPWAVIQEAWVHGVSTRKVDDLVAAMGGCQVSKERGEPDLPGAGPGAGAVPRAATMPTRHSSTGPTSSGATASGASGSTAGCHLNRSSATGLKSTAAGISRSSSPNSMPPRSSALNMSKAGGAESPLRCAESGQGGPAPARCRGRHPRLPGVSQ
jgi:hypothetical protein